MLEDVLDERPESFSYPYGDFTESVVHVVREEGFRRAVAAESARALSSADSFCLPRIHVKDWDGAEFAARLSRILRPERLSIAEPGR